MTQKTTGSMPAFPTTHNGTGMELRDYFAAKAMQGMLANNETNIPALIQASYIVADAMLKARQA